MGFWNKLGQIALQAAPYVAAPFTGGMSLMAAPMTGNLANKLEDKADRETFEKTGVAPSRNMMNKIMGGVNTAAGIYGGAKVGDKLFGGDSPTNYVNNDIAKVASSGQGRGLGALGDFGKQFMNQQLGGGNTGGFSGILNTLGGEAPAPSVNASLPNTGGAELPPPPNLELGNAITRGRNKARGLSPSYA
jgi:hypothetical protein